MLITLIVNIIAVILAWCSRFKKGKMALLASFSVIFLFLALRYDFGIDYMGYYYAFEEVRDMPFSDLHHASLLDFGYVFSNWLFARLGLDFYCFVITLSFLQCYILYKIIKEYVPPEYHWLAVFIYLFNPSMMLIQCSAMRQATAIFIFFYSIKFIIKHKPLKFILCIVLGGLFHKSCFFMLPLYWLCGPYKMNKYIKFSLLCAYWLFLFYGDVFIQQLTPVIDYVNPNYLLTYNATGQIGTGFYIIFYFLCLSWFICHIDTVNDEMKVYMKVSMFFFVTMTLGVFLMMFARIGYYPLMALVVTIPFLVHKVSNPLWKVAIGGGFVLLYCYMFYMHFQNEICQRGYVYKNFLFE